MAHTHKLIDGVRINLTAEEITVLNTADVIENQRIIDVRIAETATATATATKKASGKQKLLDLGLDEAEIKALTGL